MGSIFVNGMTEAMSTGWMQKSTQVIGPYGRKNTSAKHTAVPARHAMNGARMFLNNFANTTGSAMDATQAMTVFSVDRSPATAVRLGSPMSAVTAATM